MDELTFLLILAGVGVVLLVAMFTYYKHHKKINDEINDFNHHVHTIDDVLLDEGSADSTPHNDDFHDDLPSSFSASRQDNFDIDDVFLKHHDIEKDTINTSTANEVPAAHSESSRTSNERELVDGVYVNTKRVISSNNGYSEAETTQGSNSVDSFAPIKTNNEPLLASFPDADEPITERPPSANQANRQTVVDNSTTKRHPETSNTQYKSEPLRVSKAVKKPVTANTDNQTLADKQAKVQKIKIVYDPVPEGVEELIISHTILSKGEHFTGKQLFAALESAGLFFGEMSIYHYPGDENFDTFALFSIANVVEPGTFNPQEPDLLKTPGISMFMRLPTRMGSYEAYEEFIHVAQMIAVELDGELCDETRSQLTQQAITYKKELIRKLNFDMAKAEKLAGITR